MLNYKEILKIAKRGLLLNKVRFFLSLVGIIIGIAGVSGIVVIGEGKKVKAREFVNRLGADIVVIDPRNNGGDEKEIGSLKKGDISFLKKNCPSILAATEVCEIGLDYPLSSGNSVYLCGYGVEPQLAKMAEIDIIRGRFINPVDLQERRKVCVIEQTPTIFQMCRGNIKIGDYMSYGGTERLKIVGFVRTKKIISAEYGPGEFAYLPLSTVKEITISQRWPAWMQTVYLQAVSVKKTKQSLKEIEYALKQRNFGRLPSNLKPSTYENLVEEGVKEVKRTTLIMAAIALISLIVGGIGIMNVMYISVMERRKEIGIRRAVGAKEADIAWQFLTEALFLCLVGGLVGVLAGIFVAYFFIPFLDIPFVLSFFPIAIGLLLAGVVGVLSGLQPAIRASKIDPVEALQ
ncbi:ABC transporter permease [bacterium]|nr:ABC transporter permease [bacterium]